MLLQLQRLPPPRLLPLPDAKLLLLAPVRPKQSAGPRTK